MYCFGLGISSNTLCASTVLHKPEPKHGSIRAMRCLIVEFEPPLDAPHHHGHAAPEIEQGGGRDRRGDAGDSRGRAHVAVSALWPRRRRAVPAALHPLSPSLTSWFPRAAAARASSRPSTPCPRHAAHAVRRPDVLHGPDPRQPRQRAPRHPSMPKRFPEHPAT